ncbi:hypothetical protein C8T65DRAFT_665643 [Cerioporus squamosus]|nr:hypothetical protein C8T65DRAFT_665643 [Cerioporus squamosus]
MPNRGHQTVPRASRSASTNSMSALAAGEPQAPPGLVRPRWTRLSGGRFDGMRRNVLIQ